MQPTQSIAIVVAGSAGPALALEALGPLPCRTAVFTSAAQARAQFSPARAAGCGGEPAADLVIVEHAPPGLDGLRAVRELRRVPALSTCPMLLVLDGDDPARLRREAVACGASDAVVRPGEDALALQLRARAHLDLARLRREAAAQLRTMTEAAECALAQTAAREREIIRRLMLAAEFRDDHAGDHLGRVAGCVIAIAEGLGLPEEVADDLALASTMHDVGKIGVADHILLKPGPLTEPEREEMMQHAVRGHRMLHGSSSRLLQLAAEIALSHHERWDGKGYPLGLAGTAIPLSGRITAVADVFDALISERPYKRGWSPERARAYVEAQVGSHFDPDCVAAFASRWADIVALVAGRSAEAA